MLFHILLQDIQVLLIFAEIAKLVVIFLTDGCEDRLEVPDQSLCFTHLPHLRFLLLIVADILVCPASGILDINAALGNAELDEVVYLSQIEALREFLLA